MTGTDCGFDDTPEPCTGTDNGAQAGCRSDDTALVDTEVDAAEETGSATEVEAPLERDTDNILA